jgi:predicted DNA-binding transcriptional regulator YafY
MSDVRPSTHRFASNGGASPADRYDLDQLYLRSGEEQEVELRFSPRAAPRVLRAWGEVATAHDDGSVTLIAQVSGVNFVLSWVLGYGGDAEVVRPAALRSALIERVAKLRRMYRAPSG